MSKVIYKDVEIKNEEILIHPTAMINGNETNIDVRVIGNVIIDGKSYSFNDVILVELHLDE